MKKVKIKEKKLGRENAYGIAYQEKNLIVVDPRQDSREYMNTLIHERLHLLYPKWTEATVIRTSNALTELLWDCNYRKISK